MDIGNLTSGYTDYLKTQSDVSAQQLENTASALGNDSTDEELMDACKQFEAYLLEQVFKEMQKTVSLDDDEDDSGLGIGQTNALTEYFMDEAIADIASSSTDRSGLGVAQMLYESMKRNGQVTLE